jgi:hypothetical protein
VAADAGDSAGAGADAGAAAAAAQPASPAPLEIEAQCFGELFDPARHRGAAEGTEVKAVTYSAMQVFLADGAVLRAGVGAAAGEAAAAAAAAPTSGFDAGDAGRPRGQRRGAFDIYVVLDI